jgi:hypothetical protein
MIALATLKNWHITGLDVKTAFLYGELNKELYMDVTVSHSCNGALHLRHNFPHLFATCLVTTNLGLLISI